MVQPTYCHVACSDSSNWLALDFHKHHTWWPPMGSTKCKYHTSITSPPLPPTLPAGPTIQPVPAGSVLSPILQYLVPPSHLGI